MYFVTESKLKMKARDYHVGKGANIISRVITKRLTIMRNEQYPHTVRTRGQESNNV